MSANLNTISNIIKEQYLPVLKNNINVEPSPFLEMIKKEPLTSDKVTAVAPVGINGGFGFAADGESAPKSGARNYKRFELEPVNMYVDFRISDKTVKLANDGNALLDALDEEIASGYEAAKWNISRALFGDGTGKLCNLLSASDPFGENDAHNIISVDDCTNLIEGLTVDIYTYSSASTSTPTLSDKNKGARIILIDRNEKKIVLESEKLSVTVRSTSAESFGFLVVQGSYKKELTGLKAIFDETNESIYGCSKVENPFLVPMTVDAEKSLTDTLIYDVVKKAHDFRNSKINLVMMGDAAFKAYQTYMRENRAISCEKACFTGGAAGYKVMVGDREVTVINERRVPPTEAWCVDTDAFRFIALDFDFCNFGSDGIFHLAPGTSYYRALLASYGNLICKNPGGCVRITNAA
jgi:hypothetical protein